jgi:hypothetical protein
MLIRTDVLGQPSVPSSRVKIVPIGFPETSVQNDHSTLPKIPKERSSWFWMAFLSRCAFHDPILLSLEEGRQKI